MEPSTSQCLLQQLLLCMEVGRKAVSQPQLQNLPGHTFQFISTITFLIANKLINYATGALKTPEASLLPASARSPSLTENINLLLMLSIMEVHNSKFNYFPSEWMTFPWCPLLAGFSGGSLYPFLWEPAKCLASDNKFY